MKWIVVLIFTFADLVTQAQSDKIVKWHHIERAQALTAESPKPVFIEFTAAWCGWCKKMDKTTFNDQAVIDKLNNDFYAVKMDFDSRVPFEFDGKKYTAKDLARKYGVEGLPTMIVLSSDLKDHSLIVGYQKGKPMLAKLKQAEK